MAAALDVKPALLSGGVLCQPHRNRNDGEIRGPRRPATPGSTADTVAGGAALLRDRRLGLRRDHRSRVEDICVLSLNVDRGPHWPVFLHGLLLAIVKDPGPVGEEFGWRGFALPRLLERFSPLNASLRLGLIHAAWHLPLFFIPGMPQTQVSFPIFTLGVVSIAIVDTAIYLRTGANLLLAILVHLMANVCGGLALDAHAMNFFLAAQGIAAAMVVVVGGLRSAPITPDAAVV